MTKKALIEKTLSYLKQLPDDKVHQIADYTEFLYNRYEEHIIQDGIHKLTSDSNSFEFLENEEDLYSEEDLKEKYK